MHLVFLFESIHPIGFIISYPIWSLYRAMCTVECLFREECQKMKSGAAYTLLAAMLTMRPWDDVVSKDVERWRFMTWWYDVIWYETKWYVMIWRYVTLHCIALQGHAGWLLSLPLSSLSYLVMLSALRPDFDFLTAPSPSSALFTSTPLSPHLSCPVPFCVMLCCRDISDWRARTPREKPSCCVHTPRNISQTSLACW